MEPMTLNPTSTNSVRPPKRYRSAIPKAPRPDTDLSSPFRYTVYPSALDSLPDPQSSPVVLVISIPEAAEECPITALPMSDPSATADLSFISENQRYFCHARPKHTKATLPCGHSFSAMHLIYYWASKSMRCPCCRDGVDCPVAVESLPRHFRSPMAIKIEASRMQEARERNEENQQAAIFIAHAMQSEAQLVGSPTSFSFTTEYEDTRLSAHQFEYSELARQGNLTLRIMFFQRTPGSELLRMNVTLTSQLFHSPEAGDRLGREISQHIQQVNGARRVMISRISESEGISDVERNLVENLVPRVSTVRERTFMAGLNTISTMNQLMQGGLRLFKICVFARLPGENSCIEIESSDRICPPFDRLRDTRLIIPGRSSLQSRVIDSSIEISVGDSVSGGLSQFHVNFSDEDQTKITQIEWVPNEKHMHWFSIE